MTGGATSLGSGRRRVLYALLSVAVVVLDQVTKSILKARLPLYDSFPVIRGFFDITHVQNTGAAFGLFASFDHPFRTVFLLVVAGGVFLGVLVYALRVPAGATLLQTALALVMGGAVGNLIDRFSTGTVTDFLLFYVGRHQWPAFNVADSAITVGVGLMAWDILRGEERKPCTPS